MKGKGSTTLVYKLAIASSLYYLWLECNSRKFTQKKQLSSTIVGHIIQDTHGRGSRYPKLATRLHALNMHVSVDNDGGSSYDLGKKNKGGSGLKLSLWKREDKLVMSSEIKDLDQERKKNTTKNACIKLKLGDQKQQPIHTDYSSNNIPIRVCTDCSTTKTPLWRSGPKGPKSLCNACGIRQRKARRAMAAAANGKADHQTAMKIKVQQHKPNITKVRTNNHVTPFKKRCKLGPSSSGTNNAPKKLGFEDLLINLSNQLAFQQIFPQDEKEAAILLMALSSGLVHG
ncbi:GATA transcription factor 21-like [Solanum verrucosum]|uniref:GATA transcription factor 21-like n=1 Tax=Solanum verrucosum TaxID=315347 RepID=UPI0020D08320|nr:GATA transcription factor 21-like [Solanum verrucosum]